MITKIESGKVDISQKKIIAFARVLNTTPGYLMGWTDDHPDDPLLDKPPHTIEARILARGIDSMPAEQRKQALIIMKTVFIQYKGLFEKENNNDDA